MEMTLVAAVPPVAMPAGKPVPVRGTHGPPLFAPEMGEIEVVVGEGAVLLTTSKLSKTSQIDLATTREKTMPMRFLIVLVA
ncbi:MAG: hypothetical protein V7638_807 [Acidobacteriota bacterium]|jgi:hypothetical protein